MYEDSISQSRAQFTAITLIIGTLGGTVCFGYENYETLVTKCAVHCSRLLKRVDQCRGVALASHLFWTDGNRPREVGKPARRDGKRVLECLQKSLKIADSVMDHNINIEVFVEVLDRYVWYFEKKNEFVLGSYIGYIKVSELIDFSD